MAVRYVLSLPDPETHLAHVTVEVPVDKSAPSVDLTMPAWCPGSYLIRDYARYVRDLGAFAADGSALPVRKVDKSTWRIGVPAGAAKVIVHYRVYGHELTVRTNHIDGSHAFLHGPATFAHVPALRAEPVTLEVLPPPGRGWALACGLRQGDVAPVYHLTAASIDELYDSPLHLGHATTRRFVVGSPDGSRGAAGVPFELAVWGEPIPGGAFSLDTLVGDLGAIVEDHARRVGQVPFSQYTFLLMLSHDAYGGLEHRASSANLHNPKSLAVRKEYEGLLELLSHELFHAWNGKRIAPAALFDGHERSDVAGGGDPAGSAGGAGGEAPRGIDLSKEAHTRCLWVMEGLTSHYDRWALRTSGRIPAKSYLEKVLDDWTRLIATPGRRRQSLEESSFDAWIKLYKPDESNLNTTVSYYLKGGLVTTTLDLEIRRRTEGARSLDDVLRALWRDFGARGVPHPEDVQAIFEEATGLSLASVFDRQIRGVEDPELAAELAHVGLELRGVHDPQLVADGATPVWIGATLAGTRVSGVLDDTPAAAAGLSPGDELVAIDGFRTPTDVEARALLSVRRPGEVVEVALFRRNRLIAARVTLAAAPATKWEIAGPAELAPDAAARYQAWLGEPHPGAGQVIATVACATRWV